MSRSAVASLLALLAGLAILAALVASTGGLGALAEAVRRVDGDAPLILLPYVLVYVFDALGWYFAFGARKPAVGPVRLFTLRMAGEAINNVTPFGYMGGEPGKAMLLARRGIPAAEGVASVVIAKTLMTVAQVAFVLMGVAAAFARLRTELALGIGLALVLAAVATGLLLFLHLQRRGLVAAGLALLDRTRFGARIGPPRRARLLEVDLLLRAFYRDRRRDFGLSLGFFLLGWLAGVPEVLLMLRALGEPVDLGTALAIESLSTVVKAAGFVVPGSIGAQEAGIVAMLALFGYAPSVAMPFSLCRRAREILWIAFGLACMAVHLRGRKGR